MARRIHSLVEKLVDCVEVSEPFLLLINEGTGATPLVTIYSPERIHCKTGAPSGRHNLSHSEKNSIYIINGRVGRGRSGGSLIVLVVVVVEHSA